MNHGKGGEIPSYQQTDENDARVLQNLGYKQQLNRKFGFMSSLGLTTTVMATCEFWRTTNVLVILTSGMSTGEAYSVTFTTVLTNGGPVRTECIKGWKHSSCG